MRFAAMFLWLALPVAAYAAHAAYGAPCVLWSYSFEDNGDQYNPMAKRTYIDCTFWGPYGRFTTPADAGRCGWIKFFKPISEQTSGIWRRQAL